MTAPRTGRMGQASFRRMQDRRAALDAAVVADAPRRLAAHRAGLEHALTLPAGEHRDWWIAEHERWIAAYSAQIEQDDTSEGDGG